MWARWWTRTHGVRRRREQEERAARASAKFGPVISTVADDTESSSLCMLHVPRPSTTFGERAKLAYPLNNFAPAGAHDAAATCGHDPLSAE